MSVKENHSKEYWSFRGVFALRLLDIKWSNCETPMYKECSSGVFALRLLDIKWSNCETPMYKVLAIKAGQQC